jgi:hypothetical protein
MTTTMPRVEVQGPPLAPYPFGLLSVVSFTTPSESHQTSGVWWTSRGVGAVGTTYGPCDVDAPDPIDALDPNVECSVSNSRAVFTLYAYNDEATEGNTMDEKFARASELLIAGEQRAVEAALWAALAADATVSGASGTGAAQALAYAEQEAAEVYGGTPVMHVSRYNAMRAGSDVLVPSGTRLKSLLGSDVIAGGGYTDHDVVYATGPLVITRGPVLNLGQHIDYTTNSISAVVERTYSIGWDGFAVSVAVS